MSTDRRLDKEDVLHGYNGILFSHKKNETMPFAATWMDIGVIVLSEVSQRKTNIIWYHLYVECKKSYKLTFYRTETDLPTQKTNSWLPKEKVVMEG